MPSEALGAGMVPWVLLGVHECSLELGMQEVSRNALELGVL